MHASVLCLRRLTKRISNKARYGDLESKLYFDSCNDWRRGKAEKSVTTFYVCQQGIIPSRKFRSDCLWRSRSQSIASKVYSRPRAEFARKSIEKFVRCAGHCMRISVIWGDALGSDRTIVFTL